MNIHPIPAFSDNYIWLITFGDRQAIVVDPGDARPVINTLEEHNLQLRAILITHHCWDHVGGIDSLINWQSTPVYGPARERIPHLSHPLNEGDTVVIDTIRLDVLDVPGHTAGHIVYHGHEILFSGDTLFAAGCGRLHEGTPQQMHNSLKKITNLPKNTYVYCAHEYTLSNLRFARAVEPGNHLIDKRLKTEEEKRMQGQPTIPSTLALELQTNPFLRCHIAEVKAAAEKHTGRALASEAEVFRALRHWKDSFA